MGKFGTTLQDISPCLYERHNCREHTAPTRPGQWGEAGFVDVVKVGAFMYQPFYSVYLRIEGTDGNQTTLYYGIPHSPHRRHTTIELGYPTKSLQLTTPCQLVTLANLPALPDLHPF